MSESTPNLNLPLILPQQAQKHVTVNEALRTLDQIVSLSVLSRTTVAQPASPADGDAYILPAGKTGAVWATFTDLNIAAWQDGAWVQINPIEGFRAWIADTDEFLFHDGASWTGPGRFGVGVNADATNKLSVKSNAVLFDALDVAEGGTGDVQVKLNKEAAADTASHLFQTGFSGRAEFGLTGDDDFHLKVSADGAAWNDAMIVDKDDGVVHSVPQLRIGEATPIKTGTAFQVNGSGFVAGAIGSHSDNGNASFVGYKSRGSFAAPAIVADNDFLFSFFARGYDGTDYINASGIRMAVEGTPGVGSMPSRITFHTTNLTERMRIDSAGNVGIGKTAVANAKLDVEGVVKVKSYTVAGAPAATSLAGAMIYISDEVGGAVLAFSDGTNWRRVTDRAVIA